MKNSLTKSTAAFKTLALSAFALVTIGLASCQDLPTPTSVDNQNTNSGLVVGQNGGNDFAFDQNNDNGFSALGNDKVAPKKRIPIRCLNFTADQMQQLKELNQRTEAAKKAAREEFNKAMREIKASSTTMTAPDTTGRAAKEAQIRDLMAQDAAIQAKLKASQEELNKQLKAIEAKYAEELKNASATGGTRDNPAIKEIMARRDAEMKAAKAANEASNKDLKAQSESIRKQIETLKKSMGGSKDGVKDNRNTLSDETKAKIKAAEDAYKAKLAEIDAANEAGFRALLTPEQIAILENWLATGKGCEEPKRK